MHTHRRANLHTLIAMEWRVIRDMKKLLRKPELSVDEKARVANALAYRASLLNKLMVQKGGEYTF